MSKNYELLHKLKEEIDRPPRVVSSASPAKRSAEPSATLDEAPITAYLSSLWRQRWIVVGTTLLVMLIAGVISFLTRPTYEGVARIAIYRENQGLLTVKQDNSTSSEDSDYTVTLDTQAELIESDELANEVIRTLKLDSTPESGREAHDRPDRSVERFHDNLRVLKVPHTRLLEIRFYDSNPRRAAEVANALANAYVEHTFRVRYDATMQASKRLANELVELQEATNRSDAKLIAYQHSHGLVGAEQLIGSKTGRS